MMPDVMLVVAERSTEPVLFHVTNKHLIIKSVKLFMKRQKKYLKKITSLQGYKI